MQPEKRQKGFTLLEVLLVVVMFGVISALSLPILTGAMQRAQSDGAGQALASAIRDARNRAIATGWEYQVVAYGSGGTVPNAFRVQGFDPVNGGVAPAPGTATTRPFYGSNQMYEAYTDLPTTFGTAQIVVPVVAPTPPTFTVTFNSSGQWAGNCVPLSCQVQVQTGSGLTSLTVSQSGAVQVVKQP